MLIVPKPQRIEKSQYKKRINANLTYWEAIESVEVINELKRIFPNAQKVSQKEMADFLFIENKKIAEEAYKITTTQEALLIEASSGGGYFYALKTIKQMVNNSDLIDIDIEDQPKLKLRGLMLDISRSKVANLTELKKIVDLISDLKYNHLQLYVEGFSFEYKSFPQVLKAGNYITLQDYLELEQYAIERFIDFVPNQNGFGHMMDWLALDEFHHLAECPDGFSIWGSHRASGTLDPTNPESTKLVQKLYQDMLPYVKSNYFHMNFDEPYELGHGKSKGLAEATSIEDVYINFLKPLAKEVRKYQKRPMIWGDVLIKHPDSIDKLDKDIIFVDWGYGKDYPFDVHGEILEKSQRTFIFASGTSTWSTLCGRFDDMVATVTNSTNSAKKHNGFGTIVTDWGDIGHLQYLPFTYPGIIYGAICAWGTPDISLMEKYLENIVGVQTAKIIIELSKYTRLEGEYRDYGSRLFASILWSEKGHFDFTIDDKLAYFLKMMKPNLLSIESVSQLKELFYTCSNNLKLTEETLVKKEITNTILLLETLLSINCEIQSYLNNMKTNFQKLIEQLNTYLDNHRLVWESRNNINGYEFSALRIKLLINILNQMDERR